MFFQRSVGDLKTVWETATLMPAVSYEFNDYSRYDFNLFSEEEKRKHREAHYGIDLQNAYELGKRLVEKARE